MTDQSAPVPKSAAKVQSHASNKATSATTILLNATAPSCRSFDAFYEPQEETKTEPTHDQYMCSLPFKCPMHFQPPMNTIPRHSYDVQETEALAKLAIELHAPIDITLQSTFERLIALAGSKEFLPVAAKVRHYLHHVALKRREWCYEFCVNPYIGNNGEGLFGRFGREGMVCGGTYIVPPAILRGIDLDHREALAEAIQRTKQEELNYQAEMTVVAGLVGMNEGDVGNSSSRPSPTLPTQIPSVFIPMPVKSIQFNTEPRPCCSVDTAVFDVLGVSQFYNRTPECIYDTTPSWMRAVYQLHHDNSYFKYVRDQHIARSQEQHLYRYQMQQRQAQLIHQQNQMQFELFQLQQQQVRMNMAEDSRINSQIPISSFKRSGRNGIDEINKRQKLDETIANMTVVHQNTRHSQPINQDVAIPPAAEGLRRAGSSSSVMTADSNLIQPIVPGNKGGMKQGERQAAARAAEK